MTRPALLSQTSGLGWICFITCVITCMCDHLCVCTYPFVCVCVWGCGCVYSIVHVYLSMSMIACVCRSVCVLMCVGRAGLHLPLSRPRSLIIGLRWLPWLHWDVRVLIRLKCSDGWWPLVSFSVQIHQRNNLSYRCRVYQNKTENTYLQLSVSPTHIHNNTADFLGAWYGFG